MRTYRRLHVRLPKRHRDKLDGVLGGGIQPVRVVVRALTLRQLHDGKPASEVAANVRLSSKAVREIGRRYEDEGLHPALYDKPRPGAKPLLTAGQRKQIVAMVCADPPEGFARWTVRLIAEEAVKRKLAPKVGRETIRMLLQHDDLQPWREKNVVCRRTQRGVHRADGGRPGNLRKASIWAGASSLRGRKAGDPP
jgi:putative transposase